MKPKPPVKLKRLVIVGAGEFAQIAYEYFTYDSDYEVHAFSVERPFFTKSSLNALPVVPFEDLERSYSPQVFHVFVAVTQTQLNRVRMRLYRAAKAKGFSCANYISSHAFVWHNVDFGDNCFVFENNVLQPFVSVGNNVILWSGNHIGHRTVIQDDCFFSSHATVSGYCNIGARSFIGVNSTVADNIKIAPDNFIGAGAVITHDTMPGLIYRGNPALASKVSALKYFKVKEPVFT
ncbi:MAG: sugar O-acyltransferase [Candidatus Melainabacteria bacterium]|nr:MAG: sugar O-acyltransferase [Candidatus Melainabacteria bacterium]